MLSEAEKCILQEYEELKKNPIEGVQFIMNPHNVFVWLAKIRTDKDSEYKGEEYTVHLLLERNYPLSDGPKFHLNFLKTISHPSVKNLGLTVDCPFKISDFFRGFFVCDTEEKRKKNFFNAPKNWEKDFREKCGEKEEKNEEKKEGKTEEKKAESECREKEEDEKLGEGSVNTPTFLNKGKELTLFIKTLSGAVYDIKCYETDLIDVLKLRVQDKSKIPPEQQRLIYAGRALENSHTLGGYFIQNESTIHLVFRLRKPVIYVYSDIERDISVEVSVRNGEFSCVYPKFNKENGWLIHTTKDGLISIGDKVYSSLFWEADSYCVFDLNKGFVVKAEEAESFLEEKLKILGLNPRESCDFITYWLPILLSNKLCFCSFQLENYSQNCVLSVEPAPETVIRVFLCIQKINNLADFEGRQEQILEEKHRSGYTVVEWGGCEVH